MMELKLCSVKLGKPAKTLMQATEISDNKVPMQDAGMLNSKVKVQSMPVVHSETLWTISRQSLKLLSFHFLSNLPTTETITVVTETASS